MNEPLVAHVDVLGRFVQEAELGSLARNSPVRLLLAAGIPAAPWHPSKLSSILALTPLRREQQTEVCFLLETTSLPETTKN